MLCCILLLSLVALRHAVFACCAVPRRDVLCCVALCPHPSLPRWSYPYYSSLLRRSQGAGAYTPLYRGGRALTTPPCWGDRKEQVPTTLLTEVVVPFLLLVVEVAAKIGAPTPPYRGGRGVKHASHLLWGVMNERSKACLPFRQQRYNALLHTTSTLRCCNCTNFLQVPRYREPTHTPCLVCVLLHKRACFTSLSWAWGAFCWGDPTVFMGLIPNVAEPP